MTKEENAKEYYTLGTSIATLLTNLLYDNKNAKIALNNYYKAVKTQSKFFKGAVSPFCSYTTFNSNTVALALNKEKLEKSVLYDGVGKVDQYAFKINERIKNYYKKEFPSYYSTGTFGASNRFDSWLDIISKGEYQSELIENLRNGLLHSEFEVTDDPLVYTVRNSDWHNFEGKVFMPAFHDFVDFYFSNTHFTNEVSLQTGYASLCLDQPFSAKNRKELKDYLKKSTFGIPHRNGDSIYDFTKTHEYILNQARQLSKEKGKVLISGINYEQAEFDDNIITKIIALLEKYFPNYYKLEEDKQIELLNAALNFVTFPMYVVSNYINFLTSIPRYDLDTFNNNVSNLCNGFCFERLSALFLKLGFVLYRLQYKGFEEIDYNLVDIDFKKVQYTEAGNVNGQTPYRHCYDKIKNNNPGITDSEIKKRLLCDLIRNALCHGNVDIYFNDMGDFAIIFNDIHKQKEQSILLSEQELKKFVCSEAFNTIGCQVKDDTIDKGIARVNKI